MRDILTEALELIESGESGILTTIVNVKGSVPRHVGSKMLVKADGSIVGTIGGGKLEAEAITQALQSMGGGITESRRFNLTEDEGMLCGGSVEILFEPIGNHDRLIIFGAGHIGHKLAPLALRVDFRVTVVDDRPEFATPERFPDVNRNTDAPIAQLLTSLEFTPNTYVVIVTHAHEYDEEILLYCVQQPFAYIGMIGSRKKSRTVLNHLQEKGIDNALLSRVHTPIGLNIGAETPFEIAVSILSEMIAIRSGAKTDAMSMPK